MDTSEQYIKMCDCPEIQGVNSWGMNPDSLVAHRHVMPELGVHTVTTIWRWESQGISNEDYRDRFIWLPRQDQLQAIYGQYVAVELERVFNRNHIKMAFIDFKSWLDKQYHDEPFVCVPTNVFDSGEQLWLAFVMKEKFNKIWDGDKWVT